MANRIQLRRGTAAQWTAANPVLAQGEPGIETNTGKQKFGDGVTAWNFLPYASKGDTGAQGAPGVADDASIAAQVTNPASATATALNATIGDRISAEVPALILEDAEQPNLNTLVVIGDSLTEYGGALPANPHFTGQTFWTWGLQQLDFRLRLLANAGIGGQITASIRDRVQADVIARQPGWCHVLAGTNDLIQGVATATTQANLTTIYDALNAAGIRIIAGTIPPNNYYDGTQRAKLAALNLWLRDQARTRRNFVLVDYHAAVTEPRTGNYVSGYAQPDGIHIENAGGYAMGKAFAQTLSPLVPSAPVALSDPFDPSNMLSTHGRFPGAATAVPTGWAQAHQTVAPTYAKASRADGIAGVWQSVTVPNGDRVTLTHNVTVDGSVLAIGDTIQASVEYEVSGLDVGAAPNTRAFYMVVQCYNGSTFPAASQRYSMYWDTTKANHPAASRKGTMRTPSVVVPAGTTLVQIAIYMRGGGTYLLDRAEIRNLTRAATTVALPGPVAGNLVVNPGFETDATGWSVTNNAVLTRTTAEYYEGVASGRIDFSADTTSSVRQAARIPLTASQPVNVSLAYSAPPGKGIRINCSFYSSTGYLSSSVYTPATFPGGWNELTFLPVPTVPATAVEMILEINKGALNADVFTAYIDKVIVTQ